ncbi:hypothetical protein [uncultured Sphingomonas sp.]|uniref:hypothetical protein n=1 Tax=uncultured Sphingomonas sp. TaxID=158754 RepID=UPI0025E5A1B9|nr:hypothetical protein [uncultured Sphingomonas sp.]
MTSASVSTPDPVFSDVSSALAADLVTLVVDGVGVGAAVVLVVVVMTSHQTTKARQTLPSLYHR